MLAKTKLSRPIAGEVDISGLYSGKLNLLSSCVLLFTLFQLVVLLPQDMDNSAAYISGLLVGINNTEEIEQTEKDMDNNHPYLKPPQS